MFLYAKYFKMCERGLTSHEKERALHNYFKPVREAIQVTVTSRKSLLRLHIQKSTHNCIPFHMKFNRQTTCTGMQCLFSPQFLPTYHRYNDTKQQSVQSVSRLLVHETCEIFQVALTISSPHPQKSVSQLSAQKRLELLPGQAQPPTDIFSHVWHCS